MEQPKCKFCKILCKTQDSGNLLKNFYCQTCGTYSLTFLAERYLEELNKINNFLLHCIFETIQANKQGLHPLWQLRNEQINQENLDNKVTIKYLQDYENLPILHVGKRESLLKIISQKTHSTGPFDPVILTLLDMYSIRILNKDELKLWISDLIEQGYIRRSLDGINVDPLTEVYYYLTSSGWDKINELFNRIHSNKVFIALDFKNLERKEIQLAIQEACSKTGWKAYTIDEKDYVGGITDQIIAEIKESHFVVAEFSYDNAGVYYEAGFALGYGIPVIYVVRESEVENLHFDTRHINYITWKDYEELRDKLTNRIRAIIN